MRTCKSVHSLPDQGGCDTWLRKHAPIIEPVLGCSIDKFVLHEERTRASHCDLNVSSKSRVPSGLYRRALVLAEGIVDGSRDHASAQTIRQIEALSKLKARGLISPNQAQVGFKEIKRSSLAMSERFRALSSSA